MRLQGGVETCMHGGKSATAWETACQCKEATARRPVKGRRAGANGEDLSSAGVEPDLKAWFNSIGATVISKERF